MRASESIRNAWRSSQLLRTIRNVISNVLNTFLEDFNRMSPVLIDSYVILDLERQIVDFNRAFYSMFPRHIARGLKGKQYNQVLNLHIDGCIAQQCWAKNTHVRLDQIGGTILGDGEERKLKLILSAVPIWASDQEHMGALVVLRDVTGEAEVQIKHQEMLETAEHTQARLAEQIRTRTKELLKTNKLLSQTQKELLSYKKDLVL